MNSNDYIKVQQQTNIIFKTIKNFENMFFDEFQKCGILRCVNCKGTGFNNRYQMTFCNFCGGVGYIGFEKLVGEFVCRTCNGGGCRKCNYKGTVDWITHANGRDIIGVDKRI
jgi:RecJ-like exonuclease